MKSRRQKKNQNRPTRILVVDDHPVVRDGLKCIIGAEPDFELVGEAENGLLVPRLVKSSRAEIVVMDLTMPQLNGLQTMALLRRNHSPVKVLVLTVHENEAYLQELIGAGVSGYLLKHSAGEELVRALRTIAAGDVYFDHRLAERNLIKQLGCERQTDKNPKTQASPREEKVLQLLAWGHTNKEIAGELGVSTKSVETYRTRICRKMNLRSRTDIVRLALQRGWLRNE